MAEPVTLATVQQLADWLGESIADDSVEEKRADLCLRAASALVRKESGRTWLQESGALMDDIPDDITMVTLYCAARVYENPTAKNRGGIDDYQEGWKVDEAGAYLTASERRQLGAFRGSSLGGLGVVATTRRDNVETSSWVPTPTPDVYFPWY